jgi:hypothetical protein
MSITVASPGLKEGNSDKLELFIKNSYVDIIAAYTRRSRTKDRFLTRTIEHGKSAGFPVTGRLNAFYLLPGNSLDSMLQNMAGTEIQILIDGLLTGACLITDIDDAMNHWDIGQEYARQIGEALAISRDAGMLAELAKAAVSGIANLAELPAPVLVEKTVPTGTGIYSATLGQYYLDMLLEMKTNLDNNEVPEEDRTAFVKPDVVTALVNAKVVIDRDYAGNGSITEGTVAKVAGFELVPVPHLTKGSADNANALQGGGHVFPPAYANKTKIIAAHRLSAGFLSLKDLAMEHGRRIEYQGDMIVGKYAIGMKALRPEAIQMGTITFQS